MKISAVIIAFNEEQNIAGAITSVDWADEVLVIDSESADGTRAVAESLKAKVLIRKWQGFSKQKQFAVDQAAHDWIFSLDADERVSDELKSEILALKNQPANSLAEGYKISRLTFYMNQPIRHGGWYPDWQLRFFNRQNGKWKKILVHESIEMRKNAPVKKLKNDILHYSIPDAFYHNRMIADRYAPLAAEQMFRRGRKTSRLKVYTAGITAFLQTYALKLGFLDGFAGFCIARFAAHHAFLKHLLLWEMQNNQATKNETVNIEVESPDL